MHSWFKSYLTNRTQYVCLNEKYSSLLNVDYGVPQGSVLGPILFLLYINDIGSIPNLEFHPKIFADDTNILVCSHSLSDLKSKCQDTINRIADWMLANRLTVNQDKTNYMIFSPNKSLKNSPDLALIINNSSIKKVNSIKYLGVYLDENLDWKIHIHDICQSLRKYVGIFYKLSLKLPKNILRMLYFALVYPRILYAIEIYANTYVTYLHDLIVVNNRLLRILQHQPSHATSSVLYESFNTLPINKLFQYQILLHAHAITFSPDTLPKIFLINSQYNNDIHMYNTRASHDFHRVAVTSVYGRKISHNIYTKMWNMLPMNLKIERRSNVFKKLLKQYLNSNDMSF